LADSGRGGLNKWVEARRGEGEFLRLAVVGLAKDQFSLIGPLDGDTYDERQALARRVASWRHLSLDLVNAKGCNKYRNNKPSNKNRYITDENTLALQDDTVFITF